MSYLFYDSSGSLLGEAYIVKPTGSEDFYSPLGLDQFAASNYVNYTNTFTLSLDIMYTIYIYINFTPNHKKMIFRK